MKIEILEKQTPPIFHRVKKGETLEVVAGKYNKNKNILRNVNMLEDNYELREGDLLIVNYKASTYVVKPLDTLTKIATKFNTTPEEIKAKNKISDNLFIGQIIII